MGGLLTGQVRPHRLSSAWVCCTRRVVRRVVHSECMLSIRHSWPCLALGMASLRCQRCPKGSCEGFVCLSRAMFLDRLPPPLLQRVLAQLSVRDRCALSLTCRTLGYASFQRPESALQDCLLCCSGATCRECVACPPWLRPHVAEHALLGDRRAYDKGHAPSSIWRLTRAWLAVVRSFETACQEGGWGAPLRQCPCLALPVQHAPRSEHMHRLPCKCVVQEHGEGVSLARQRPCCPLRRLHLVTAHGRCCTRAPGRAWHWHSWRSWTDG